MDAAVCAAVISGAGILVIAVHGVMDTAICAAVISGAGIFVVTVDRIMDTATCTVIISGTCITVVTAYRCIKNCSITGSQINIGVRVPNFFWLAEVSVHFKWFPC
jgi:hypothetical protein